MINSTNVNSEGTNADNNLSDIEIGVITGNAGTYEYNGAMYSGTYDYRHTTISQDLGTETTPVTYDAIQDGFMLGTNFKYNSPDSTKLYIDFYFVTEEENETELVYVSPTVCTRDMFPDIIVNDDFNNITLGYFLCPNTTEFTLTNNGYNFSKSSYFVVSVEKCEGTSCASDADILLEYGYDELIMMHSEGYLNTSDVSSPVHHRLSETHYLELDYTMYVTNRYELKRSEIHFSNSEIDQFSTLENVHSDSFFPIGEEIADIIIELADTYDLYEQYIDYQPVISQSETSEPVSTVYEIVDQNSNQSLMSFEYCLFYMMAQIGGLFSFLKLIIG